jgi:hypothetical protein
LGEIRLVLKSDRELTLRTLLMAAFLLWPILVFGTPAYFSDSISYHKGGQTALAITLEWLSPAGQGLSTPQGTTAAARAAIAVETAKGSRSVLYSVAAYLLAAPGVSMTLLAVAQALATGWVVAIVAGAAGVVSRWSFAALAALVAFATPAAVFVCYIVPDIFAGLLIASFVMLTVLSERLSGMLKLSLVALGTVAVTSHASHPPIAAGLLVLGSMSLLYRSGLTREARNKITLLASPLVLGALMTVATGFVGFGTLSLAPKRYPLTLARSIEDGPARWYLAEHCGTRHYAVCEVFGSRMPASVPEFLWENGLTGRATPEQMDRIRAEESQIVAAAARAYPLAQAKIIGQNVAAQIIRVGLEDVDFDQTLLMDRQGALRAAATGRSSRPLLTLVELASAATGLAAAIWLAWAIRRMHACGRVAAAMLLAGLLGNAAVCAIFSGVADRYQARVVWLLPLFALSMIIGHAEWARRPKANQGVSSR